MATLKNLLIRLGIIADDIDGPVNRTNRGLERLARQADSTERSLGKLAGRFDSVGSAASSITSRIASFTGSLASAGVKLTTGAVQLAVLSSALASATTTAAGLVAAVAPLTGLLAALPGIALTGGAAMTVWKLATTGLGEAMGAALSGNVKALGAAMDKLSGSGKAFVAEFESVVPTLKGFQAAAQDAFLSQINGELRGWLASLAGLKPAIRDVASELGGLVRTFFEVGTSRESILQLDRVLRHTQTLVAALAFALEPLMRGFLDLGAVGAAWLASLGDGITSALTRFGEWMSAVAGSGQAWRWMDDAADVLKQLGAILADVWGILTGVFRAIQVDGQGALGVFGSLLDGVHKFVDSAQGQEILGSIFRALLDIGQALVPVVTALAGALGGIAPTIGQLAQLIGPILTTAIQALAPAIEALGPGVVAIFVNLGAAVQTLADSGALTQIAMAITDLLIALTPLLPALADILVPLLHGLAWLVSNAVAPALATLIGWIQGVINAIKGGEGLSEDHPLSRFAAFIRDTLMPVVQQAWDAIVQAFTDISAWANENRGTFEAWGAKIVEIVEIVKGTWKQIWEVIVQVFADVKAWIVDNQSTWMGWGDRIASIVKSLAEIVSGVWEAISIAWDTFGGPLLDLIGGVFGGILQVIDGVMTAIKGLIEIVLGVITGDWERAWEGVKTFFSGIWEAILGILNIFWAQIKGIISAALAIVGDTWEGAWTKVKTLFTNIWTGIAEWFGGKINDIKGFVGRLAEIPGQVTNWFGQVRQGIIDKFGQAVEWIRGVPGRITSALGNMGNLLYNAGRDLVLGFWNGVVSLWNWLVTNVQNLFGGLADWAKRILGIASPSKVFAEIGKQIPAGMAAGIGKAAGLVETAVAGLATTATVGVTGTVGAAFAGGAMPVGGGGVVIQNLNLSFADDRDMYEKGREFAEGLFEFQRRGGVLPTS